MEIKYSILMPFHKRHQQFSATLCTFAKLYSGRSDYEILVGVDVKNDETDRAKLIQLCDHYSSLPIRMFETGRADCWNPGMTFNLLAQHAEGEYLVITNPECLHETDVLAGLDKEFERDHHCYVVCACRIPSGQWFQHSVHRPVKVHFCSALSHELFSKICGFDEAYSKGVCFEDDDFRNSIEKLGVSIIQRDDLLVMHQLHNKSKPKDYARLHHINKLYYERKWGHRSFKTESLTVEMFIPKD